MLQAIGAVTKPSLTLFDNRAATHEKLNDLQAALRDGKQMLELDKSYVQVSDVAQDQDGLATYTETGLLAGRQDFTNDGGQE